MIWLRTNKNQLQALRRAEIAENAEIKDFQSSLSAIIFLGTPHRGSGYAEMGDVLRRVAAATGMDTNDKSVRMLKYDSPELETAQEEFTRQWRQGRFKVKTFQEARGFKGVQGLNEKVTGQLVITLEQLGKLISLRWFRISPLHLVIRSKELNILTLTT